MQGKRSAIGSLPDSINFDYGSTSTNMGVDQQICWNALRDPAENRLPEYRTAPVDSGLIMGAVSQEARDLTRWNIGEPSSRNPQNPINRDVNERSSSMLPSVGVGPRLEDQVYDSTSVALRNGVDLNLNVDQVASGTSFLQTSQNGSMSHSPEPFATSSGTGGFLVEDEDSRPGFSLDGRRLSCKRKNIEGSGGSSSSSGIAFSREGGSMWQTIPPPSNAGSSSSRVATRVGASRGTGTPDQVNPRLRLSIGGVAPDSVYANNVAVGPETSRRNYRVRTNPSNEQDSLTNNSLFPPVNPPWDFNPPIQPENSVGPQAQSAVLRVPGSRRNSQSLRSSGASSSRSVDAPLHEDLNSRPMPRNISEHPMFRPVVEVSELSDNPAPNLTGWYTNVGGLGTSRNVASSSRAGPGLGSHSSSSRPTWGSHRLPSGPSPSQYSRRLSEYVQRTLLSSTGSESGLLNGSTSAHRSAPPQGPVIPSTGGTQGPNPPSSRSALFMDRHVDGVIGIPYSLRALAAGGGEGRSRLVSEHLRNVLDMMRRGEGLRFEDVMIFDPSVLFGMADIHDEHRDMRLDIDNMSYEELLALEDRIGSVCTGLTEEKISAKMKQRKYTSVDQAEVVPCCICQEVYKDGEDMGVLDCGHDFHSECVKQWLTQKNSCPICKTTGLAA